VGSQNIKGCTVSIDINMLHALTTGFDPVTRYGERLAPNTLAFAMAPRYVMKSPAPPGNRGSVWGGWAVASLSIE